MVLRSHTLTPEQFDQFLARPENADRHFPDRKRALYAPDVAFKRTPTTTEAVDPHPPELAAEVVSPSDDPRLLSIKISNYLAAGTLSSG